jgi:branched-subunit amino acid transport protein AzlD
MAVSAVSVSANACDRWICRSLGGSGPGGSVWLARLRGLALASAALTVAMSAWKMVGPLTTADLLLVAAVLLLLPRFSVACARRMWVPALAVGLIAVGGVIGTAVTSGADVAGSAEMLIRLVVAALGAMLLVVCWRPGLEQIKSFSWLWIAGGVVSATVALLLPDLDTFPRPPGLTPHPAHLAIISLVLLGVALGLIAADRRRYPVVLGFMASAILFAAVVASGSRAGLAAALLILLLALIATRARIAVTVAFGIIVVGGVLILLGIVGDNNGLERIQERGVEPGEKRAAFNAAAWDDFTGQPVTGVGFEDALEPHNFALMSAAAAGVLGIIGAAMIILLALRSYAFSVWKRMPENAAHWAMAAGLSAAVIGYLAASAFQNVVWDRTVWIAIALMTWAASTGIGSNRARQGGPPAPQNGPG